jgi:hypothetical protein
MSGMLGEGPDVAHGLGSGAAGARTRLRMGDESDDD